MPKLIEIIFLRRQENDSTTACYADLKSREEDYQNLTDCQESLPSQDISSRASSSKLTISSCEDLRKRDCGISDTKVTCEVSGRRIIDIQYFFNRLKALSDHGPLGCGIKNLEVVNEKIKGFKSIFTMKCNMCNFKGTIHTDNPKREDMDINTSAVTGAVCTGIGHRQLEELTAAMDIPAMSSHTYTTYHDKVSDGWERTAVKEMEIAAKREAELAVERGDVDEDGVPIITVYADGQWAKRSYKNSNYSALSGVAAIVGFHTRKILFISVRNKYCTMCARADSKGEEVKSHQCYKNWSGSSSSMEADILVQGFKSSVEMYGVKYGTLIADGDCSVYNSILNARPYSNLTVNKIECRNHVLRNYLNKLKDITTNSSLKHVTLRKALGANMMRMRTGVTGAVRHWKNMDISEFEKVTLLRKDLENVPRHVFGDHTRCSKYFCPGFKDNEVNIVPLLEESGLMIRIDDVLAHCILRNARSLLKDVDSNCVEQFNSIIAKYIGGKRINFCLKRAYSTRNYAAVVAYNTNTPLYKLHKTMYERSPGKYVKTLETKRKASLESSRRNVKRRRLNVLSHSLQDKNYGPHSQRPDMTADEYEEAKTTFLQKLPSTTEQREEMEKGTLLQRDSGRWKEVRRRLLTASNFGSVCRRLPYTKCDKLVVRMLYGDFDTDAMLWGRENEKNALQSMEETMSLSIRPCGLFVDPKYPYLGATPDGVIGSDGIVEVKCPSSAKDLSPDDAIQARKVTFWNLTRQKSVGVVNKKHYYYYQVQGQLHVTRRRYCVFCLWTPLGMKIEKIQRDDEFWYSEMEEKLKAFYNDCILPELVDPRHTRSMPIRNPLCILQAIKEREEKMKVKRIDKPTKKPVRRKL